uniref:Homeodomain transcription factor n=1 Tax=Steinernema glaseri TaxID=37863 RepID=A0A1I8A6Y4_9BILA
MAQSHSKHAKEDAEDNGHDTISFSMDHLSLLFMYFVSYGTLREDCYASSSDLESGEERTFEDDLAELTEQEREDLDEIMHNNIEIARLYKAHLAEEVGWPVERIAELIDETAEIVEENVVYSLASLKRILRQGKVLPITCMRANVRTGSNKDRKYMDGLWKPSDQIRPLCSPNMKVPMWILLIELWINVLKWSFDELPFMYRASIVFAVTSVTWICGFRKISALISFAYLINTLIANLPTIVKIYEIVRREISLEPEACCDEKLTFEEAYPMMCRHVVEPARKNPNNSDNSSVITDDESNEKSPNGRREAIVEKQRPRSYSLPVDLREWWESHTQRCEHPLLQENDIEDMIPTRDDDDVSVDLRKRLEGVPATRSGAHSPCPQNHYQNLGVGDDLVTTSGQLEECESQKGNNVINECLEPAKNSTSSSTQTDLTSFDGSFLTCYCKSEPGFCFTITRSQEAFITEHNFVAVVKDRTIKASAGASDKQCRGNTSKEDSSIYHGDSDTVWYDVISEHDSQQHEEERTFYDTIEQATGLPNVSKTKRIRQFFTRLFSNRKRA